MRVWVEFESCFVGKFLNALSEDVVDLGVEDRWFEDVYWNYCCGLFILLRNGVELLNLVGTLVTQLYTYLRWE